MRVCLVAVVVVIAGSAKTGSHGGEEGRKRGGRGEGVEDATFSKFYDVRGEGGGGSDRKKNRIVGTLNQSA